MARDGYVEVKAGADGLWRYQHKAGNHRVQQTSEPYQRRAVIVNAAVAAYPDLEVKVFDRPDETGRERLDRVVSPDY